MITIIIKSFNRPYYLDRCLQSITKFVQGDYNVVILDDGTPEKYLQKIMTLHPFAEILKSDQYNEKVKKIEDNIISGQDISGFDIPTKLWYKTVEKAYDYVLVTEDDVWFTKLVHISNLALDMKNNKIELLKLGWFGNFSDEKNINLSSITEDILGIVPKKLFLSSQFIMDCFMFNRFKFFTVLYKLGLVDNNTQKKYWVLNSIAMGIYRKNYWLHIWKNSKGKVDEKQQLSNAAAYYHQNKKNPNTLARLKNEVLKTTFQSSATNSYHQYNIHFDVNYFNHLINEAWLSESFDAMENFPKDFSFNYFAKFIDDKINLEEFRNWVFKFKEQYRNLGANVDD